MAAPRIDNLNSYQNLMINGNFDFWQRNTTFAAVANNAYTTDRWQHGKAGSMVATISRSTDVPTVAQSGFASQYSLLYTVTTAQGSLGAGDYASIGYKVEGQDYAGIAGGQAARIQFWIKSSITGTYSVALRNSAANRSYVTTVSVSAANTWERKIIDFVTDSAGTWLLDNNVGLILTISLGTGTTFQTSTLNTWQAGNLLAANSQTNLQATNGATFQIAQVMLVKGSFPSSATSLTFQRAGRTIQQELAMCQRYYVQPRDLGDRPLARMHWYDANALYFIWQPLVQLRAHPTIVNASSYAIYSTAIILQTGFSVNIAAGPLTNAVYFAASKGAHGLTDGVLHIANLNAGVDAEL